MKTLVIIIAVVSFMLIFMVGPEPWVWLLTWDLRRAKKKAEKQLEEDKLNAAIAKANFKAKMRHFKNH